MQRARPTHNSGSFSRPPRRSRRAILAALVLAVCAFFAFSTLESLGVIPAGTREERVGLFEIEYRTYDAFGHRGTERTLYYRGSSRRHLVARAIAALRFNPNEQSLILYEYCPSNSAADCGVYLFDGRRLKSWRVSDERLLSEAAQIHWTTDQQSLVIAAPYTLRIVRLADASRVDLSDVLGLRPGGRTLRLADWSPDQRRIAGLVGQYIDPAPPFVTLAEDLIVIDVAQGSARYVATAQPRGWTDVRYEWVRSATGYTLAVPQGPVGFGRTVYQKTAAELPLGILPQ